MSNKEILYIAKEDLYRFGNSSSSQISRLRLDEIDTYQMNDIEMVNSSDNGISLYNKEGLEESELTGWVWEIKEGTSFPFGLKLIKDNKPLGHYTLAPAAKMPFKEYVGLLEKVAIYCEKIYKKKA